MQVAKSSKEALQIVNGMLSERDKELVEKDMKIAKLEEKLSEYMSGNPVDMREDW